MSDEEFTEWKENLESRLEQHDVDSWTWADVPVDPTGLNVVCFSSGEGDGVYATYYGLDTEGSVVALMTDFALFQT